MKARATYSRHVFFKLQISTEDKIAKKQTMAMLLKVYMRLTSYHIIFDKSLAIDVNRDVAAAVTLPLVTAALIIGCWFIIDVGCSSLAKIVCISKTTRYINLKNRFKKIVVRSILRNVILLMVLAFSLALAYLVFGGVFTIENSFEYRRLLIMQVFPLWAMIIFAIVCTLSIHTIFRRLLKEILLLTLFEAEKLQPISYFLFVVFLVLCFPLGAYSLSAIFIVLPWIDVAVMISAVMVFMGLLVMPLNSINVSLTAKISETLSQLNSLTSENDSADLAMASAKNRRLIDDSKRL